MDENPVESSKASPQAVEELEQMYSIEEPEVIASPPPGPPPPPEQPRRREPPREEPPEDPWQYSTRPRTRQPEANPFAQMMSGDIGLGEALLIMEYWDRKDRKEGNPSTSEDLVRIVTDILENRGITAKPSEEPEWAKAMRIQVNMLTRKNEEDKRKKEQEDLIKKVTEPLKKELETERDERKRIENDIEALKTQPTAPEVPQSEIDQFISYKTKLVAAGFLKADNDGDGAPIKYGADGIPVSGSIPAWTIYAPTMVDQIFDNIEKRVTTIAGTFGVGGKKELGDLINLPHRPETPPPTPPLRPITPAPAPAEEPATDITPPGPPEEPEEELIKLPVRVEPEPEEEPEIPLEPEPEPQPVEDELEPEPEPEVETQGLRTSDIEYEPQSDVDKEPEEKLELPVEPELDPEPEVEPEPEPEEKTYYCKHCQAGPFEETWQLAQHVRGCDKAKEAKEAE